VETRNPVDLESLLEYFENACEQAVWNYRRNPSARTYAVSYGKLDGIFQGVIMALRAAGMDVVQEGEIETVRKIIMKFQAELMEAQPCGT
jgi:hypothetical protein